MATITITIPDELLNRVLDGFSGQYGYMDTLTDDEGNAYPNPETKSQFTKRMLRKIVKDAVKTYEGKQAGVLARKTAFDLAEQEIDIQ